MGLARAVGEAGVNVTGMGLARAVGEADDSLKLWIIGVLCVLIILGNVAVLLVISSPVSGWSKNSRLVLLSLTGADAALALVVIPLNLYGNSVRQLRDQLDSPFCHMVVFLDASILTSSIYSLATISIERYIAVFFPLRYSTVMTNGRVKALIALVWLLPPVLSFPISIPRGIVKVYFSRASLICNLDFSSNVAYSLLLTAFIFFPCSLIMTLANFRLWFVARSQKNRFKVSRVSRRHDAASRVLVPVVIVYYSCWSPCVCNMIYQGKGLPRERAQTGDEVPDIRIFTSFEEQALEVIDVASDRAVTNAEVDGCRQALTEQRAPEWLEFVALWLPCGNGFFNCIVYFWLNRSFRKKFQEMGQNLCRCNCFVAQNGSTSQVPDGKDIIKVWKQHSDTTARACSISSSTCNLVSSSSETILSNT
ncbi:histamine H2 receptor isoform X1 [Scyliorhinus canicula]|uniref:histamine H2 receptor isoform X1 n=1 Tax=Scyliorhinus canicula TaxID=7830 RepID=UPI0018F7A5C3|nr:histamine H2 receptor isoform X1 [Scyliorhinus canicula]